MTSRSTRIGAPTLRSRHAVLASLTVGLMALTACSSGSSTEGAATQAGSTGGASGPVTLTLATFNQFGYEELIPEFEKSHPNIKVTHKKAATSNEARDNFFTRLSAGSGMADVEAVEVDWLPEMLQYSDKFTDLNSADVAGPLARLEGQGRHRRRRPPHRLRHGLRPRGHLLPQRPLQGGRPAERPRVGRQALRQHVGELLRRRQAVQGQVQGARSSTASAPPTRAWSTRSRPPTRTRATTRSPPPTTPTSRRSTTRSSRPGSPTACPAKLQQWGDDWTASFQKDGFATMLCPGWMVGVIEGNAKGVKGWDVANTFPGGGGNWGGSYLTVPEAERPPEGGPGARRVADRPRAAGQGLQEGRRLPEPEAGPREPRPALLQGRRSSTTPRPARSSPTAPRPSRSTPYKGTALLRRSTTRCSRR